MATARDAQRDLVYQWEHKLETQIPRLYRQIDDLLRVRRYCEATFREFGFTTNYPAVQFRSNLGKTRKGGKIQGLYKTADRSLYFRLPVNVSTILHESVHGVDHRMSGRMRSNPHGPEFVALLLRVYRIAIPDDWAVAYASAIDLGLHIDDRILWSGQ